MVNLLPIKIHLYLNKGYISLLIFDALKHPVWLSNVSGGIKHLKTDGQAIDRMFVKYCLK